MDAIDRSLMLWLNQFAHRWMALDLTAVMIDRSLFLGGGFVMVLFWWAWFRIRPAGSPARAGLSATLFGSGVALAVGRALALALPFRLRPIRDESLHLVAPYGVTRNELRGWSSFPSDHALLYVELAAGVLTVDRGLGAILLFHALVVVSLPRIYTGLHYPSDVVGGALIGALIAWGCTRPRVRDAIAKPLLDFERRRPHVFYAGLFLFCLEVSDMLNDPRALLGIVMSTLSAGN